MRKPRATIPAYDRVMAKTRREGDCLVFTGTRYAGTGYGWISEWVDGRRKARSAHTVVWEHHNGPVPPGMCVMHSCDNRPCVEWTHLSVGTYGENNQQSWDRSRQRGSDPNRVTCANDHPLTEENKVWRLPRRPGDSPLLTCRECARESAARYKARKREMAGR